MATRLFQKAIRIEPDLADAHYNLAQVYLQKGLEMDARKELEVYRRLREKPGQEKDLGG